MLRNSFNVNLIYSDVVLMMNTNTRHLEKLFFNLQQQLTSSLTAFTQLNKLQNGTRVYYPATL